MMKKVSLLLGLGAAAAAGASHDISALVQGSVRAHKAVAEERLQVSKHVSETEEGPLVYTKLGPMRGADMIDHLLFAGIDFVDKPERFEVGRPPKSWAPETYDATKYKSACIGAEVGDPEGEDCLSLNIWIPKGGHTNMPVIVYFHGGINQHGSGSEGLRRGDGIVQSEKYPTIFVNFNFRLGIFGWISLKGSNITENLGFLDQQAALRWVQEHISAFGGDPDRVALQGQSEGSGIILAHMVAPGSKGLFHRAAFHSPVADMWSRSTNQDRTRFMIRQAGCKKKTMELTVACLKRMKATKLWAKDWVTEELSRNMGSYKWSRNAMGLALYALLAKDRAEVVGQLGWHPVVDNVTLPGEPRELIQQGKFHKVPVLLTVSKNETYGCIPGGQSQAVEIGLGHILAPKTEDTIKKDYRKSLEDQGIVGMKNDELLNEILTDKLWTCDARSLANELTEGGGRAHLGMFWHSPRYDSVGRMTSPICEHGATCHAAEMLYVLPQGGIRGIHGIDKVGEELGFSKRYSDSFLAFVHGKDDEHPWKAWDSTEPMTFYDKTGSWVVPGYRRQQCDILDKSVGTHMPAFMRHAGSR